MTIRNIICDLDGTLIDSARMTGKIIDEMLADRGVAATADRAIIRAMDAVGGEAMITAVMGQHLTTAAADIAEFRARHRIAQTQPDLAFPGVAETLANLCGAGIRLAICSNKPQFLCDQILSDLGLARHFASIIGSEPSRPKKPSPASATLALTQLGAGPDATLYFGDSVVDLATARAAGLPMVLAGWGYGAAQVRANAPGILTIDAMPQLLDLALPDLTGRGHP